MRIIINITTEFTGEGHEAKQGRTPGLTCLHCPALENQPKSLVAKPVGLSPAPVTLVGWIPRSRLLQQQIQGLLAGRMALQAAVASEPPVSVLGRWEKMPDYSRPPLALTECIVQHPGRLERLFLGV